MSDPRLVAFLEDEAQWHLRYAELCRTVSSSLNPGRRVRELESQAQAALRSARSSMERLTALQAADNQ